MRLNHFSVPTVQAGMSEADLDQFCRGYLQGLVDKNLVVSYFEIQSSFTHKNTIKKFERTIMLGNKRISTCRF